MSLTVTPRRGSAVLDRMLRVAARATTPLLPADIVDLFAPLRSGAELRGKIVAVHPETRDAVTVTIQPGRGWAGHVPGQYIRIGVDVAGVRQWRAYSVTSRPDRADGRITITAKAIAEGKVSNHLLRRARAGTVIQLDQAQGAFVLPQPRPDRILFVTAGSGITPVMGMLRSHLHELGDVVLVHSSPTADDVVFGPELRALAASGRLRLIERHTAREGLLDPAEIGGLVPDFADRAAWVCGPTAMLDALETHWENHGLADRITTERFRPTVVATGEGGAVRFTNGAIVQSDGGTPILDAAEDAGVLMPSGCRMGICYGCVLPLREGAVRDLRTGEVTVAAPGDGVLVQTCISAAAGPCHLDH